MCGCVWVCICALIGLFSCINLAFNLNVLLISHDIYIDLSILISEQHQREYEETEGREKSVAERRKLFEKPQGKNDVPEKIFVPQERNVMNKRQEEKEREEIMRKSQGIPVSEQHQREYEETEGPEKSVAERRKLFEKPQGKNAKGEQNNDEHQKKDDVPEKIFGKCFLHPLPHNLLNNC
ncbi:stress response protein NST1 isoform X4 [Sus scrofa]|uniref:stress response protein NST1 isoform X4 n=1 Tax=Sus scrofa TaxID=9823 RepID=UPI000A2B9887|nr:stress response protein NST1 isoform X4 [Sus scrofa]